MTPAASRPSVTRANTVARAITFVDVTSARVLAFGGRGAAVECGGVLACRFHHGGAAAFGDEGVENGGLCWSTAASLRGVLLNVRRTRPSAVRAIRIICRGSGVEHGQNA